MLILLCIVPILTDDPRRESGILSYIILLKLYYSQLPALRRLLHAPEAGAGHAERLKKDIYIYMYIHLYIYIYIYTYIYVYIV